MVDDYIQMPLYLDALHFYLGSRTLQRDMGR